MIRGFSYALMACSLGAAVLLSGGAQPQQWQWSAVGISIGSLLALFSCQDPEDRSPRREWGLLFLGLLVAWMTIQWIPIPLWALQQIAPERWAALNAVHAAIGSSADRWASLSTAPAATLDRLMNVLPAAAAFLGTRQMACWWRDRIWIVLAPVVAIAFPEGILGMLQFYGTRMSGAAEPATGTYIYHNHFAGLMEMAFPLTVLWAVWIWRQNAVRHRPEGLRPALKTAALFAIAACILGGLVASLSRMGFISMAAASAVGCAVVLIGSRRRSHGLRWLWAIPAVLPALVLLLLLPPTELIARFGQITTETDMTIDARTDIWRDTLGEVAASPWTGVGLGAYEHGLYRFKTTAPINTVDFAHNDYLQILAEVGIPGATLAVALGIWILMRCGSVATSVGRRLNGEFAAGLLVALVALGLHSTADFNLYSPANALVLAWLAGVAVSPGLRESS